MTETEKNELREVRIISQRLKEQIELLQSEIEDNKMAITNLKKWRKGRSVGFFVCLAICLVLIGFMFPQVNFWADTNAGRGLSLNDSVSYALSSTSMIFAFFILVIFAIVTIIIGIKLVMEVGKSKGARSLAHMFGKRNYYTVYDELAPVTGELQRAMFELKQEKMEYDRRLKELEALETPWYLS